MVRVAGAGKPIRVVSDQGVTSTISRDLAEILVPLILTGQNGLCLMTDTGECLWFDFCARGISPIRTPQLSRANNEESPRRKSAPLSLTRAREQCLARRRILNFRTRKDAVVVYLRERKNEP